MGALRYNVALGVANILFGVSSSLYVSLLQGAMLVQQLFSLQLIFAMFVFAPIAIRRGDFFRLSLNDFGSIFIVALLVVFGWWYLLMMGASYTNPIDASTIVTLGPIFTFITSIIAHSRRAKRGEIFGILTAFVGAAIILFDQGRTLWGEGGEGYGNALVLCAVIATSANTVLISPVLQRHGAIKVMGWYYLIGVLLALPLLVQSVPTICALQLSHSELAEVGYILLLGSALPMLLLYVGTEHLTAAHTAIYRYIQPIVATILAVTRGQSVIDRTNIVGAVLIFLGVLFVILSMPRAERTVNTSNTTRG